MVLFLRWSFYRGGRLAGFPCTFNTVSCSDFERGCWNHSVQTQILQQHQQVRCNGREGKCGGSKKGS